MAKAGTKELRERQREQSSLFCHKCRTWKVSQEKVEVFASHDGAATRPVLWTCPDCRGEGHAPTAAPVETEADTAKAERLGPFRAVTERLGHSSKTGERARLECGHEMKVFIGQKRARCRKCRVS